MSWRIFYDFTFDRRIRLNRGNLKFDLEFECKIRASVGVTSKKGFSLGGQEFERRWAIGGKLGFGN